MIESKVIFDKGRHITRADYGDKRVLLRSENVRFPKPTGLQARALYRLLPAGKTLSHREFDLDVRSTRLSAFIRKLRLNGWPIVNHDYSCLSSDPVPRLTSFTRYELFAEFTPELEARVQAFYDSVHKLESRALIARAAGEAAAAQGGGAEWLH